MIKVDLQMEALGMATIKKEGELVPRTVSFGKDLYTLEGDFEHYIDAKVCHIEKQLRNSTKEIIILKGVVIGMILVSIALGVALNL